MANWAGDPAARQGAAMRFAPRPKRSDSSFGFDDFLTKILLPAGGGIAGAFGGPGGVAGGLAAGAALGQGIEKMQKGDTASVAQGIMQAGQAIPAVYGAATPPSPGVSLGANELARLAQLTGLSPDKLASALKPTTGY